MFIPRIFRPSGINKPKARGRRSQSQHLFQLEPLENRTPLSAGLDVGFAGASISKPPQFRLADFSLSPPIDSAIQGVNALDATTVADSGGLFAGSVYKMLPAATADFLPLSPGSIEPAVSIFVTRQSTALLSQTAQPTAVFEFGTSSSGFGSYTQVENALSSLSSIAVANDALVVDLTGRFSTVSRDVQDTGTAPSPIPAYIGTGEIVGPRNLEEMYDFNGRLFTSPPPPGPVAASWPGVKLQPMQTDLNSINDPDVIVLGSLISTDSHKDSSDLLSMESASGHGSGFGFGLISTGLSIQMDLSTDSSGNGWMSYVATGGWVAPEVPSSVFRGDVVPALDETAGEPTTPASITAGEVPLSILLSGPDAPAQTGSDRLEQVAELIPLEESSLALVATLWTVSSDSRTTPPNWDVEPAGGSLQTGAPSASPPSWTVYVIGLNEAFEQSRHDVEQGFLSSPRRPIEGARGRRS